MQLLRLILFPVSFIYGFVVWVRNILFNAGILKHVEVAQKTIVVGNLSAGGTGKSPMTMWIVKNFGDNLAVLSRGYGRKSIGFAEVESGSNYLQSGDEPLSIKRRYPETPVYVCESRVDGAANIQELNSKISTLVLDDAYQHRHLLPGISLLLTTWDSPYFKDWYLPTGDLRDSKSAAARASAVIVTKCPDHLPDGELAKFKSRLKPTGTQKLAFTRVEYGAPQSVHGEVPAKGGRVVLVTGIANSSPFENYCADNFEVLKHFKFKDHHAFKANEIEQILFSIGNFGEDVVMLTTEKDSMRLFEFEKQLQNVRVSYIPIEIAFLEGEEDIRELITNYTTQP